jgi:tubulin polyglutamylase TTLL4
MFSTSESNKAVDDDESDDDDNCDLDEEELSLFRDPPMGFVRMRPSHFRGLPSTVFIEYPPELGIHRIDANSLEPLGKRKLVYSSHWERVCIKNAFVRAGFTKTESANSRQWTAMFSKHQSSAQMKDMNCLQKINHFPASWCIGRKDRLLRTINMMRRIHGKAFDFHPEGYILPGEKDAFVRHVTNDLSFGKSRIALLRPASASLAGVLRVSDLKSKEADRPMDRLCNQMRPVLWITKPVASSCGKGISVMTGNQAINSMGKRKRVIMQKYLDDPYLIDGKKFDLRICKSNHTCFLRLFYLIVANKMTQN